MRPRRRGEHRGARAPEAPPRAAAGGFHLFAVTDSALAWTGARLRAAGLCELLAGHRTGIEATYRLRAAVGLDRRRAVVSAAGSSHSLDRGIDPLQLARERRLRAAGDREE